MPEVLLGLDIGSQNVKAVIARGGKNVRLLAAEVFATPPDAMTEGELVSADGIAERLRAFIDASGARPAGLAVCVNSPNLITRKLTLPQLSAAEIPAAVKFEIYNTFPSVAETHVIAQKLIASEAPEDGALRPDVSLPGAPSSDASRPSMTVLAALCPSALIGVYSGLAARLGLPLLYADIRANAQLKAIARFGTDSRVKAGAAPDGGTDPAAGETGLLVDIGASSSLVSVVTLARDASDKAPYTARQYRHGQLLLSRYVTSGAAAFDAMLAERAGVPAEEAARARQSGDFAGISVDIGAVKSVVDVCFAEIAEQARQTAEFHNFDRPGERVSFVSVVGEGGMIADIDNYFAVTLGIKPCPVGLAETGAAALAATGLPKLMLGAVGCAIREDGKPGGDVNFATTGGGTGAAGGVRLFGRRLGRLTLALAAAAVIAAVAAGSSIWYAARGGMADAEAAEIAAEMAKSSNVSEQESAIAEAGRKLSELNAVIAAVGERSAGVSALLEDLAAQAPETLFAISLSALNADEVTLSGKSKDYESVAEYALLLRATEKYASVRIDSITVNQVVTDALTDYSFAMTIRY